jgi:hypothetical protein
MGSSETSGASFNSSLEGIEYYVSPPIGAILEPNTEYIWWFNITANLSNLVGYKIELLDNYSNVLATNTGVNPGGGNLSISLNVYNNHTIIGRYSIDTGGGYFIIDADSAWSILMVNSTERGTIYSFFKYLKDLDEFGEETKRSDLSRMLFFWIILFILVAAISFQTGWDVATQGGAITFVMLIVWIASYAGFMSLNYLPAANTAYISGTFLQKYAVAIIATFLTLGHLLNKIGDEG